MSPFSTRPFKCSIKLGNCTARVRICVASNINPTFLLMYIPQKKKLEHPSFLLYTTPECMLNIVIYVLTALIALSVYAF